MAFFDRFKKKTQNSVRQDTKVAESMKNCSGTAVEYAEDFDVVFDFSVNSINGLEEILDYYSKDISKSQPTENQIWSMSLIFGSYLGEVMLRNGLAEKGYGWGLEGQSTVPLLVCSEDSFTTPVDKVYKRLKNGREDSVVSYYRVMMEMLCK